MLAAINNPGTHNDYMCVANSSWHCTFLWTFRKLSMNKIIGTVQHIHIILLSVIELFIQSKFFHTAFGWMFHILKQTWTCRRLAGLAYFCAYSGRTSPRAGHRAGPPRSRQAGTVGRSKRKGSPRVEKTVAKRGERSDFHSIQWWHDFGFPTYSYSKNWRTVMKCGKGAPLASHSKYLEVSSAIIRAPDNITYMDLATTASSLGVRTTTAVVQ